MCCLKLPCLWSLVPALIESYYTSCGAVLCSVASAAPSSVTPWAAAHQAPLPKGFPGKNTGVRCHFLLQYINSSVITWSESPGSFLLLLIMHYFSLCTQQLCVIDSQFFFFQMNLNFWWSTENFIVYTGNGILCEHFFIKFLLKIIGQTSKKKGIIGGSFQMKL